MSKAQIIVYTEDDSDDDCRRESYFVIVNDKKVYLERSALRNEFTKQRIEQKMKEMFNLSGGQYEID